MRSARGGAGRFARTRTLRTRLLAIPEAAREGEGVAATFFRKRILHGPAATRAAEQQQSQGPAAAHAGVEAHPASSEDGRAWELRIGPVPAGRVGDLIDTCVR